MADPVSIIWNVYKAAKFVHKAVKDGAGIDGDLTSLKIQVSQVKEKMRIISGGTFDDKTPENSTLAEAAKKAQNEKLEGHCEKLEGVTFKEFQEHLVKLHDEIKISKNAADSLAKDPTGPGFWSGLKAGVKKAKGMVMASSNRDTLKQHTGNLTTYLAALTSIVQGMYVEKFKALEGKFDAELAKISGGIEVLTWQTSIPQKREELKKVPKKDYQRRHSADYVTVEVFAGSKSSVEQQMKLSKAIVDTFEIGGVDGPRLQEMAQQILADVDLAKVVSGSGQTLKKFKEGIEGIRNGFEGFKKFVADFQDFSALGYPHYMILNPDQKRAHVGEEKIKEAIEEHAELIETNGDPTKLEAYYKKHAVVIHDRTELKEILAKSDPEGAGVTLLERVLQTVLFRLKKIAGRMNMQRHSKTMSTSKESMRQLVAQIIEFYEAYTVEAATTELSRGGCFTSYAASATRYNAQKKRRENERKRKKSVELGYHPTTGTWGPVVDDCRPDAMWLRDAGFKTAGEGSREANAIQKGLEAFDKQAKPYERAFRNFAELQNCWISNGEMGFEKVLEKVVKCILPGTNDLDSPWSDDEKHRLLADGKSCFKGRSFRQVHDGFVDLAQADDPKDPTFFEI